MKKFSKDPAAVLDYAVNWSPDDAAPCPEGLEGPWLIDGDTIAASTWTVPSGLTKTSQAQTDTVATVWLAGGTLGERYEVVNHITTTQGRTENRTFAVVIEEH